MYLFYLIFYELFALYLLRNIDVFILLTFFYVFMYFMFSFAIRNIIFTQFFSFFFFFELKLMVSRWKPIKLN